MDWREMVRQNALGLGIVGVGVVMSGVGVWQAVMDQSTPPVEVHDEVAQDVTENVLVVEISGEVNKPGVYEMKSGERLFELIERAEGMTQEADRDWVAKSLNQAERLKDGQKVYIPAKSEMARVSEVGGKEVNELGSVAGSMTVNVNTATQVELEELWGVGEARAQAIIENRPYASLEEFKTKAKIPENVLERNKGKISVF
jgi:competence protein ComEA